MQPQQIADIITSCWALSADVGAKLPSGQDILDRALQRAISDGNFPAEFKEFRFVKTPAGISCPELRDALSWAQAADQTTDPNPEYSTTAVRSSKFVAKVILQELNISADDAVRWGHGLVQALRAVQSVEANPIGE